MRCPVCGGPMATHDVPLAKLTPQQRQIVEILSVVPGKPLTSEKILAQLYGVDLTDIEPAQRTLVYKQISIIRKKYPGVVEKAGSSGYRIIGK